MSAFDMDKYLKAVDEVCVQCHYLNEKTCEKCPVRKTADEKRKQEESKMMTFEEACEKDRDELVNVFEIETADNICQGCIHLCDCPACVQFHNEQPSDSISACKFYEA